MNPPNKKAGKAVKNAGVLVRGQPAREGDRTRAGNPVAITSPVPPRSKAQTGPASAERSRKQSASDAERPNSPSEMATAGMREAGVYLAHLVFHLHQERKRRGMSLADLSAGSGLDRAMLSKLENGRIQNPTFLTLWRYARALDDSPALLLLAVCRSATEGKADGAAPF
jgi:hypothetical protein